ncbi:DUF3667 domain-containing protein [Ancylomarina sp. 16SWW S1-10-2]|uniref:DUF3667 domain-containing protein n=1 Tax=Ancylomarina sp. 16SWW S1-10-2 TaxID=2499681 RepID=UPI00189D0D85|nr:DUF3667 domain-containing protein [Ancylomarina sp. 16SWW S1-10-2]
MRKSLGLKINKFIPKLSSTKAFHYKGLCPNCNHPVDGKFCPNCGQSAKDFHRPFLSVVSDSLGEALSLDNKFFRTLLPLIIRPGFLTKEFMKGRRATYTPPFPLYLFLTFFAFLLLASNHRPETDSEKNLTIKSEDGKDVQLLSYFDKALDRGTIKGDSLVLDSLVKDAVPENKLITNNVDSVSNTEPIVSHIYVKTGDRIINDDLKNMINLWRLNPTLMMDNAFKKLSQTLFFILPLFALFLALFYIRRKHFLLEHLLISLNFHSFIFVVVIVSELLIMTGINGIYPFAFSLYLLIPIQLFLTLKFYYEQSWFKTVIKFLLLSLIYNILLLGGILYSLLALAVE